MSWDLAISEHGDFIFNANRDLAGVSGTDLIEQRMKIRMRLMRGSWTYDEAGTLGSNLRSLVGMAPDRAATVAPALVREALRPMDEIVVDDVRVDTTSRDITLVVSYHLLQLPDEAIMTDIEERQLSFTLPFAVAGGV